MSKRERRERYEREDRQESRAEFIGLGLFLLIFVWWAVVEYIIATHLEK